jgi:hypothetical protein
MVSQINARKNLQLAKNIRKVAKVMFSSIAYSNDFSTCKKMQKKEHKWKIKKQNLKTEKHRKQNKWKK